MTVIVILLLLTVVVVVVDAQQVNFVASGGPGGTAPGNTLAWSSDGKTWTGSGNSVFDSFSWSVVYCAVLDLWVATGGIRHTVAYSHDGNTWVGVGTPVSTNGNGAYWHDGLFIAVGGGGTNTMARSIDGKIWTPLGSSVFNGQGYAVYYSQKTRIWVAAGCCENVLAWSSDGFSWTGLGRPVNGLATFGGSAGKFAFSESLNLFVVASSDCCFGRKTLAFSTDGKNWALADGNPIPSPCTPIGTTQCSSTEPGPNPSPFNNVAWDVIWDPQTAQFVACGGMTTTTGGGATIATSRNGMNWTQIPSPFDGGRFQACQGISYSEDAKIWFASGSTFDSGLLAHSQDLVTWTPITNLFGSTAWGVRSRFTVSNIATTSGRSTTLQSAIAPLSAPAVQVDSVVQVNQDLGVPGAMSMLKGSSLTVGQNLVITGSFQFHSSANVSVSQLKLGPDAKLTAAIAAESFPGLVVGPGAFRRTVQVATINGAILDSTQNPIAVVAADSCTEISNPQPSFSSMGAGSVLSVTVDVKRLCDTTSGSGSPSTAQGRLSTGAIAGIAVGGSVLLLAALAAVLGGYAHWWKHQRGMRQMTANIEAFNNRNQQQETPQYNKL